MRRMIQAAALAVFCVLASASGALAQRLTIVVAPVRIDSNIARSLPPPFSPVELKRELEIALESTGIFSVINNNSDDLNQVLDEMERTGRRSARAPKSDLIMTVSVMSVDLGERRRPAPNMRDRDLATVSGKMALRYTVMKMADASVQTRASLDVVYTGKDRLADPIGDGNLGQFNARTFAASPADFVALSQEAGRMLATNAAEHVSPIVVVQNTGAQIWLSRGEDAGYRIGERLRVFKIGPPAINPITHEKLGDTDVQIGEAEVVEVRPRLTIAKIVNSTETIAAGAVVREALPSDQ